MNVHALLLIGALVLFSVFVQDSDGYVGSVPVGTNPPKADGKRGIRKLKRKVCKKAVSLLP